MDMASSCSSCFFFFFFQTPCKLGGHGETWMGEEREGKGKPVMERRISPGKQESEREDNRG